jgi:hypothetical protein
MVSHPIHNLPFPNTQCKTRADLAHNFIAWANNPDFLARKTVSTPGFDAIIGQAAAGVERTMDINGNVDNPNSLKLPVEWVISKGGEYFFSPSISALREEFALKPTTLNGNGVHGNGHSNGAHLEL